MKESSPITIREAGLKEVKAVSALMKRAFKQYRPLYTRAAYEATTPNLRLVRQRMEEGPVWVAEQGGKMVGTLSIVSRCQGLYLRGLAVEPKARGAGVAKALVNRAKAYAILHNIPRLFLSTAPFLHAAIRLYERMGFRRCDQGPDELHGTELFTMERVVGKG